jgi:hypothetical protein
MATRATFSKAPTASTSPRAADDGIGCAELLARLKQQGGATVP